MRSKTNSTYVNVYSGQKAYNEFRDAEDCIEVYRKRQEVYLRSYYETKYTFDNGGYVLFDTLTYDDEHCPWASDMLGISMDEKHDFRCFNPTDYKDFMKRLRSYLSRRGYDVRYKIKFQYVTEYGTADYYTTPDGRIHSTTHRPHYHVLFYVTDLTLEPEVLSKAIKSCWNRGRTDGVEDQPKHYANNIFRCGCSPERMRGLTYYIAKYITKDSEYQQIVNSRYYYLEEIMLGNESFIGECKSKFIERYSSKNWYSPDFEKTPKYVYFLKSQIRKYINDRVNQFHRTSLHFGEYALADYSVDGLIEDPYMSMPDTKKVVRRIPLPLYYRRKLFYDKCVHSNGKEYWTLNADGERFMESCTYRAIERLATTYSDKFATLCKDLGPDSPMLVKIVNLLDGRTWEDFANYKVLFQDRFYDTDIEDISEYDYTQIWKRHEEGLLLDEITEDEEKRLFTDHVIDSNTFPEFNGFDQLDGLMKFLTETRFDSVRQETFDNKELMNKRYRDLGFRVKNKN